MARPLVVQRDPEKLLTDYLAGVMATLGETPMTGPSAWTIGTRVKAGTTPVNAVRVRAVGGTGEGSTHARPRLDVRVWGDGTALGESAAKNVARLLHAHITRDLRASTFASPVVLPDPADGSRTVVLFTVQLLTKGAQA